MDERCCFDLAIFRHRFFSKESKNFAVLTKVPLEFENNPVFGVGYLERYHRSDEKIRDQRCLKPLGVR